MDHTDLQILHLSDKESSVSRGLQWFHQPISSRLIIIFFCICAGLTIVNIVITVSSRGSRGSAAEESVFSQGDEVQYSITGNRKASLPPDNETYDGACPDDWSQFQDSCYYFSNLAKSWTDSHRMCQRRKATLTVINTKEEQAFLTKLAMKIRVWIGLSEIDGEWKWVDGTPFSSTPKKWATNQPDEYFGHGLGGGEDCVQLYYSGDWNDEHCSRAYRYICEKTATK